MNIEEDHFEITEINNLIDNLEMVSHFLESLISVLQGTDPRQTVVDRQKDSGKAVMLHVNKIPIHVIASSFGKSEESIRDWITNPYLISLDEALRRVKKKEHLPALLNAQPLTTTPEEDDAIRKLTKEFRNEFEHFAPKAWLVFTSGIPSIFSNVVRVIHFLEFESNCVRMSIEQEQRLKSALERIGQILKP
jgi:hypothetical protein